MRPGVFLKLGGALLTEKDRRESLRADILRRLTGEITAWAAVTDVPLVVAHGSGSFAHVAVGDSGFADHPDDRLALARVMAAARRLNVLVADAFLTAGLPVVPVPGGLLAVCRDGAIERVRGEVVAGLLAAGLVPLLFGDGAPDRIRGGAIASTEALLLALSEHVALARVILATDVDGVFEVDPHGDPGASPYPVLTPASAAPLLASLGASRPGATDVTGGMATKVHLMLRLVERCPDIEVRIVSGFRPGAVAAALAGDATAGGTVIRGRS